MARPQRQHLAVPDLTERERSDLRGEITEMYEAQGLSHGAARQRALRYLPTPGKGRGDKAPPEVQRRVTEYINEASYDSGPLRPMFRKGPARTVRTPLMDRHMAEGLARDIVINQALSQEQGKGTGTPGDYRWAMGRTERVNVRYVPPGGRLRTRKATTRRKAQMETYRRGTWVLEITYYPEADWLPPT